MHRDRLVFGVNDSQLQLRLLAEIVLTFGKALELAQALEEAEKNANDLAPQSAVHAVCRKSRSNGIYLGLISQCYKYGVEHLSTVCKFKDADCRN